MTRPANGAFTFTATPSTSSASWHLPDGPKPADARRSGQEARIQNLADPHCARRGQSSAMALTRSVITIPEAVPPATPPPAPRPRARRGAFELQPNPVNPTMEGFEVPLAGWRVHATAIQLHLAMG